MQATWIQTDLFWCCGTSFFLRLFQPVCAALALFRFVSASFTLTTMAVGNTTEGFASVLSPWSIWAIKGSVDRSLLPSAIFLIFTRSRSWMSEDHLSTLFFIEMSKERLEKSERTPSVSWRPWALAYSRDRPYNLSCLSAMSKNGRLRSFSSALGCYLARKSLWWPTMLVSNKKQ